jgi:hypothetical protein
MGEPAPNAIEPPEPHCRNCGAAAPGAYCARCGQETRLRVPTLREFAREAGGRYVALDGVLWRTLGALLLRPGFLTREYLAGRRRRYVRPFRLYLAASLVCFLVVGIAAQQAVVIDAAGTSGPTERSAKPSHGGAADATADDVVIDLPGVLKPVEATLRERVQSFLALTGPQRARQILAGIRHNAPYAMFVLVPAFALLLKLAYAPRGGPPQRPRRYGEHLVFTVHNHAFFFFAMAAIALVPRPIPWLIWAWIPIYFTVALRAVYGGGWRGTALRSVALALAYLPLIGATVGLLVVAAVLIG